LIYDTPLLKLHVLVFVKQLHSLTNDGYTLVEHQKRRAALPSTPYTNAG
jgi:hypothetical protein